MPQPSFKAGRKGHSERVNEYNNSRSVRRTSLYNQARRYRPVAQKSQASRTGNGLTTKPIAADSAAKMNLELYKKVLADPMSNQMPPILPDEFHGASVPLCLTTSHDFLALTDTFGGICLSPELDGFILHPATTSTETAVSFDYAVTVENNHHDFASGINLTANGYKWRPLVLACSVAYVGSNDNLGGTLRYCFAPNRTGIPADTTTWPTLSSSSGEVVIRKEPVQFISKLYDAPMFEAINSNSHAFSALSNIVLVCDGVNPADLRITCKMYIEIIPSLDGALQSLARPSTTSSSVPQHDGYATVQYSSKR